MEVFSSKWEKFLLFNGIKSADSLWKRSPVLDFDNLEDTSGFSLVSRLNLKDPNGFIVPMILKQQWLPYKELKNKNSSKKPPLVEEALNYKRLRKKGVKALPSLAASGNIKTSKGIAAFALYRELDDYISLDHLLSTWGKSPLLTRLRKKTLLTKLGSSIRQLHDAKFAHHALSPEHLFIRFFETENEVPRVDTRIIDLEQGEMKFFFRDSGLNDLKKLLSYANDLSTSELLRFYLSYQRTSKLSKKNKLQILEKILA